MDNAATQYFALKTFQGYQIVDAEYREACEDGNFFGPFNSEQAAQTFIDNQTRPF